MNTAWRWLKSDPNKYDIKFVLGVIVRVIVLLVIFNGLYLVVQPLDQSSLTLYNRVYPGRLRLGWTYLYAPVAVETRLPRLIADHVISRPKAANEFRVVVLGSSDVWGYLEPPQGTMPVVLDSMGMTLPDGRVMRFYNLSYVYADSFKDLLILDEVLKKVDKPDLVIFTANLFTFQPLLSIHWLTLYNPDLARQLVLKYHLWREPLPDPSEESWFEQHNFWSDRQDIASWLMNEAYGWPWTNSETDYPVPVVLGQALAYGGRITWKNQRPGVLQAVVARTHEVGIPTLFVSVPENVDTAFPTWMQLQARVMDIPLLDCSTLLPPQRFTDSVVHLSPEGHRLFAQAISTWLQKWLQQKLGGQIVTICPSWL